MAAVEELLTADKEITLAHPPAAIAVPSRAALRLSFPVAKKPKAEQKERVRKAGAGMVDHKPLPRAGLRRSLDNTSHAVEVLYMDVDETIDERLVKKLDDIEDLRHGTEDLRNRLDEIVDMLDEYRCQRAEEQEKQEELDE